MAFVRLACTSLGAAVLLLAASAALPGAAAETAATGVVTQHLDGCADPGHASFVLDRPEDLALLQSTGACGHVHAPMPASACQEDDGTVSCDHTYENGNRVTVTLHPDGTLHAMREADGGAMWTLAGNLDRVDL